MSTSGVDAHGLGVVIDAACYLRGVTTADVAAAMGVSHETVRRWRRGDTAMRLDTAWRLADYLRIPPDLFMRPPASRERALAVMAAWDGASEP